MVGSLIRFLFTCCEESLKDTAQVLMQAQRTSQAVRVGYGISYFASK